VKPNINYVSQQIFNEQMQTIEMTCVKISFKDQQILNIWCPYVVNAKSIILLLFRLVACPSFKQIN
jgi:hypothetical protein